MKILLSVLSCFSWLICFAQEISPRYELVKMNDNINSRYDEVSPVISPDGKKLYFFVSNHPQNNYGKDNSQDIWVSSLDDNGQWSKAEHLGSPFNGNRFNQVFNFMSDGSLFIRGGRSKNSKGFTLVSPSGHQQELDVTDFDKMNKGYFYGATLSADGKQMIIYFSEKEKDKSSDLYLSSKQPDGHFSMPVKLKISSAADDFSPFIAPDQKTMYFASSRFAKGKVGGVDVYKTTRLDESWRNWSEPVNLGRTVNTPADDAYFTIDANGNIFTARAGSKVDGGNFDLLMLKPRNINIILQGMVFNSKTQQPINAATVEVKLKELKQPINLKTTTAGKFETKIPEVNAYNISANASGFTASTTDYKVQHLIRDTTLKLTIYLDPLVKQLVLQGDVLNKKTNAKITSAKIEMVQRNGITFNPTADGGSYKQDIPSTGWYVFNVTSEGYLNAIDSVQVMDDKTIPVVKNIVMTPIEVGMTVRLKNIYFDYDKTTLKEESFVELDKVVDFLQQNPKVSVEISGHTDSNGSDEYNLNLSQGRSQSVVDYIVSQGIDAVRLQAHGYGEAKPIDTNDTDEGRANNRRVEFTILKN